jgi:NADP-dependent 3-hydroxy acid dehydrogenase YdfG
MPDLALDGTVALVTGAGSGIGAATGCRLALQGATMALVARCRDRLDELAGLIADQGATAIPIEADITDPERAGLNSFTESLRQELLDEHVRVSVVEPGSVDTELVNHLGDTIRVAARGQVAGIEALRPSDIADAIAYIVTRERRVAVNEILVRAGDQTW